MGKNKSVSGFTSFIIRLDHILEIFESTVGITCFVVMTGIVMLGIISRFFLHIPFMWTEEASRYLMMTGVYIGISLAVRDRAHLGLTGPVDMLPEKPRKILIYIREIITIIAFASFAYYSIEISRTALEMGQKSPALKWPMWIIYIPLITGFILSTIRSLMMFWNDYIHKEKVLTDSDDEILAN